MKLIIKNKDGASRTLELAPRKQPYTIGRDAKCDVILNSTQVSAVHAHLQLEAQGVFIQDAGSINGVYIANKRIGTDPAPLTPGQECVIAEFTLTCQDLDAALSGASALRRRHPARLPAALLVLLILLGTGGVWWKRRAPPPPPSAKPDSAITSNAAFENIPTLSAQQQTMLDQAAKLIRQGESAMYEHNDYIGAARCFNAALTNNPNNLLAANYLALIREQCMPGMIQHGETKLAAGDMAGARNILTDLEVIAPDDDNVQEYRRIITGLDRFKQARSLIAAGDWAGAAQILEAIIIPDDQNRVTLLEEARRQIGLRDSFRQTDDMLRKLQYAGALTALQHIMAQPDVDQHLIREVQERARLLERIIQTKTFVSAPDRIADAVTSGAVLLTDAALQPFPSAQNDIKQILTQLRAQLLPDRGKYAAQIREQQIAMAAAEAAGRDFDAIIACRTILNNSIILEFLDEQKTPAPGREQLRRKIRNYALNAFQRGYVLKEQSAYDEALPWFNRVLAVVEPYDDLAIRAREQCAAVQALISARPTAAAAARNGLNTASPPQAPATPADTSQPATLAP